MANLLNQPPECPSSFFTKLELTQLPPAYTYSSVNIGRFVPSIIKFDRGGDVDRVWIWKKKAAGILDIMYAWNLHIDLIPEIDRRWLRLELRRLGFVRRDPSKVHWSLCLRTQRVFFLCARFDIFYASEKFCLLSIAVLTRAFKHTYKTQLCTHLFCSFTSNAWN